jgi:hypothetical protein
MSEYQYYEWQTLDRALTREEMAEVNGLSSHIEVTATHAVVTYSWGDFKHNQKSVLARYFDAFLYWANWGSRELMFRLPKSLLDERDIEPYLWEYHVELEPAGDFSILQITPNKEDGDDWLDTGFELSDFVMLRDDIVRRDYRSLYLAWLRSAELEEAVDEEVEPPVPPGLSDLSAPLISLMGFLGLDQYLLEAAAQGSKQRLARTVSFDIEKAVAGLPRNECDSFLARLARNEPYLSLTLMRRLQETAGEKPQIPVARRRTWGELSGTAKQLRSEAEQRKREEAEARRLAALQALAAREPEAWSDVYRLIDAKQPKPYDEAVSLLVQLRDLAIHQRRVQEFEGRVADIRARYSNRPGLLQRLAKAGLR